jgi:hypothetical protein
VKSYIPREEVKAMNEERQKKGQPLEPLPPIAEGGDPNAWWVMQIKLDGWTESTATALQSLLSTDVVHVDTVVWCKEVDVPGEGRFWRYNVRAAPAPTVASLASEFRKHWAYISEIERPAMGKKIQIMSERLRGIEKVVFYGSERLLDGEAAETIAEEMEHDPSEIYIKDVLKSKEELVTPEERLRQLYLRFEGRLRILEGSSDDTRKLQDTVDMVLKKLSGINIDEEKKKEKEKQERVQKEKLEAEIGKKKAAARAKKEQRNKERKEKKEGEEGKVAPVEAPKPAAAKPSAPRTNEWLSGTAAETKKKKAAALAAALAAIEEEEERADAIQQAIQANNEELKEQQSSQKRHYRRRGGKKKKE